MATGKWVSGVNIGIARDTERSSISLTHDRSGSLFTNLAHPDAVVARSELISAVNFGVAIEAEKSRVGSTVDCRSGSLARVAWFRDNAPSATETLYNTRTLNSH